MKRHVYTLKELTGVSTPNDVKKDLAARFRERRKEKKLSRKKLSELSGVSYSSIRRFEETGSVSLDSLLLLADKIGCLDDFSSLFVEGIPDHLD